MSNVHKLALIRSATTSLLRRTTGGDGEGAADRQDRGHMISFLHSLFALDAKTVDRYPGINAYCMHLHRQSQPLLQTQYAKVWCYLHIETSPDPVKCWIFLTSLATALRRAPAEASIIDLWRAVATTPEDDQDDSEDDVGDGDPRVLLAVFSALCWMTMMLNPALEQDNGSDLLNQVSFLTRSPRIGYSLNGQTYQKQHMREANRPVSRLFAAFRSTVWHDWSPGGDQNSEENDNLYEGSLTFWALQQFSRINIEWVDTIGEHLTFDLVTRRLCVFRFPSFCVLSALRKSNPPILDRISEEFRSAASESSTVDHTSLEQEILLSYRLLFGQSSRSQKLARSMFNKMEKDDQPFDSMLRTICGKHSSVLQNLPSEAFPVWCRDAQTDQLRRTYVYNARTDFPRLGYRLVQLQKFSLRQKPRSAMDLWRDRRNMLQWYTFWAVIWLGGVATLLALAQTILQGLQLRQS